MIRGKEKTPRLLTAGYLTLDLIVRNLAARDYWHSSGGTCGNVSIFASALGLDVALLARVGEDLRGLKVLSDVVAGGINAAGIEQVPGLATPGIVELITGTPEGDHRFTHRCPECAIRLPKQAVVSHSTARTQVKSIKQFDAFFFDRATSATLLLAAAAREAGLLVMFEPPNVPRTTQALRAAELSDIVKTSRRPGFRGRDWELRPDAATRFIVETLGPKGVRVRYRSATGWGEWQNMSPFPPPLIKDTAGAGDWMTVGMLTNLLPRKEAIDMDSLLASIEYGQRLSAISIAFDSPAGALTALGSSTIRRVANGAALPQGSCNSQMRVSKRVGSTSTPSNYCKLCLTQTTTMSCYSDPLHPG